MMKNFLFFILVVGVVAFALDKNSLVDLHNQLRKEEAKKEGVSSMLKTEWKVYLENSAENITEKCKWEGYPATTRTFKFNVDFLNDEKDVVKTVKDWVKGKEKFDYKNSKCLDNNKEICIKYLNVVNDHLFGIGCTLKECKQNPNQKWMFVCAYVSQAMIQINKTDVFEIPYIKKNTCSGCNYIGGACEDGLCVIKNN